MAAQGNPGGRSEISNVPTVEATSVAVKDDATSARLSTNSLSGTIGDHEAFVEALFAGLDQCTTGHETTSSAKWTDQQKAEGSTEYAAMGAHAASSGSSSCTSVASSQQSTQRKSEEKRSEADSRRWRTTWARYGPLSGIASIFLAIVSLGASFGILAGSDGQKISAWSVQPATYLAIFTAISDACMKYAFLQGVLITWWERALRGSTIVSLHRFWNVGTSIGNAIMSGRHMGLVGIACILSTLVAVDGPLLQRASAVYIIADDQVTPLTVNMIPELPRGFSGYWEYSKVLGEGNVDTWFNSTIPTTNGWKPNDVWTGANTFTDPWFYNYTKESPLGGIVQGCPGSCRSKIRAPGLFPTLCQSHTILADPLMQFHIADVNNANYAPPLENMAFVFSLDLMVDTDETLNLITGNASYGNGNCTGEFTYRVCKLMSGIGEYDVLIENDQILTTSLETPALVALANNTARIDNRVNGNYPSTLGAVAAFCDEDMSSAQFFAYPNGSLKNELWTVAYWGPAVINQFSSYNGPVCPTNFTDPYEFALNNLNKLMLYMGAACTINQNQSHMETLIDPGLSITSVVEGYVQGNFNAYRTDYWWFLAAAMVDIVCIVCILPTYWGWWEIGRPVSFSPLEIAKAFDAPLLAQCNSNSTADELAEQTEEIKIKYGIAIAGEDRSKLAFRDPTLTAHAINGESFDA